MTRSKKTDDTDDRVSSRACTEFSAFTDTEVLLKKARKAGLRHFSAEQLGLFREIFFEQKGTKNEKD